MEEKYLLAVLLLAGIEYDKTYQIANEYWPDNGNFVEERRKDPWWLVKTPYGMVKIGWRKRVINIDWEDTFVRVVVTKDDVTKDETMVHAYGYAAAVIYLRDWKMIAQQQAYQRGDAGAASAGGES